MTHLRTSILGMALIISVASFAHAEESKDAAKEDEVIETPKGMVRVEQTDLVPPKPPEHDFNLKDYKDRRNKWGGQLGFGFNFYDPGNYQPQYVAQSYSQVYPDIASTPLLELQGVVKRNFDFGSIGIEFGVGGYSNNSTSSALVQSTLSLTQYRIGVIYIDEMMMQKRYIAPYISAGAYIMQFDESQASDDFVGNTQAAPYITVGAQFSMDWIEPAAARLAYEDADVQSTYLFVEIRKYFASFNSTDPDFESGIAPGLGMRIEF